MTMPTRPISTMAQIAGTVASGPTGFYPSHRFLRTELPAHLQCQPETKTTKVIIWEPVILPLLERLANLRSLPEEQRWPGTDWPTEAAFQDAGRFADGLPQTMRIAPHISLADDGEVNFAWSRDGMRIDLGFYGTGAYSFYARDREGEEWFGDDISVTSPLPKELAALLAG